MGDFNPQSFGSPPVYSNLRHWSPSENIFDAKEKSLDLLRNTGKKPSSPLAAVSKVVESHFEFGGTTNRQKSPSLPAWFVGETSPQVDAGVEELLLLRFSAFTVVVTVALAVVTVVVVVLVVVVVVVEEGWPSGPAETTSNTVVLWYDAAFEDLVLKKLKMAAEFHSLISLPSSTLASTPHNSCFVTSVGTAHWCYQAYFKSFDKQCKKRDN